MPHFNRSKNNPKPGRYPQPSEVIAARNASGLTQTEAAHRVYSTLRIWQDWESEAADRRMRPGLFELFLIKTGQTERLGVWITGRIVER